MISRSIGALCDQFLMFAIPLTILKETNSVKLSALAFVIEWIPRVVFFPLVGGIIDRFNLKKVLIFIDLFRVLLLLLAIFFLDVFGYFVTLSGMMAFISVCYVVNFVSIEAIIPNNIAKEEYAKVHSVIQAVEQFSQVIGPALAGLIYLEFNINGILFACIFAFLISSINLLFVHIKSALTAQNLSFKGMLQSNMDAVKFLFVKKHLLYLCGLTWVVNILYGTALAISVAIVVKHFQLSEIYYSGLQTISAMLAIPVFTIIPLIARRKGILFIGKISLLTILLSGLIMATAPNYFIYLVGYALLISFDGGFNVYIRTMRSTLIPKEHLGKVIGVIGALNLLSIPLSGLLVSSLSSHLSLLNIILIAFFISLILSILLLLIGKFFFGYQRCFPEV